MVSLEVRRLMAVLFQRGMLLGVLYEAIRFVRTLTLPGKVRYFVVDYLFCLICGAVFLLVLYRYSNGILRWYMFPPPLLGALVVRATLGRVVTCLDGYLTKRRKQRRINKNGK